MRMYDPVDGTKIAKTNSGFSTSMEATPQTPITTRLLLGQHYQERILLDHLEKMGTSVEFGSELRSFKDCGDYAAAQIVHHIVDGEDKVEEVKTSWLIGCDGAHSIVRKTAGMRFSGETMDEEVAFGDIKVKGDTREFWDTWGEPTSKTVYLRPSGQRDHIVQFLISGPNANIEKVLSSREAFIEEFYSITGSRDIVFEDLVWSSRYRPNIRMVEQVRVGRVLIGGDAAHCHSPAGGQGLNSSIQDFVRSPNRWKLALVCKGYAPPSLLDTYGEERLPVVSEMLQETTRLWDQLLAEGVQSILRGTALNQLGVNYRGSSIVYEDDVGNPTPLGMKYNTESETAARPGDRAPGAPGMAYIKTSEKLFGIYDIFSPSRHTLLVFSDPSVDYKALSELIKALPYNIVRSFLILPKGVIGHDEETSKLFDQTLVDTEGHAFSGYHINGPSIAIVRPDGVIGARVHGVPGIRKYFEGILHN